MDPIVHIVDDDKSFRTALARLMGAAGFRTATYESGEDLLARLSDPEAGCILLDLHMPGLSGLELQDQLAECAPMLPILLLTGRAEIRATVQAIKAGAEDFLEKPASREALLEAVDRALRRCDARRAEYDRIHALKARLVSLTPREFEVFGLITRGRRNKQIAYDLSTSERTVKAHRRSAMEKLGVGSLAEAVSIAERLGLLNPMAKPPQHQNKRRASP